MKISPLPLILSLGMSSGMANDRIQDTEEEWVDGNVCGTVEEVMNGFMDDCGLIVSLQDGKVKFPIGQEPNFCAYYPGDKVEVTYPFNPLEWEWSIRKVEDCDYQPNTF